MNALARSAASRPAFLLALLLLAAGPAREARADIYRWVDEQGVLHFTDDEGAIPAGERGRSKVFIKEGPKRTAPPATPAPPPPEAGRPAGGPPPDESVLPAAAEGAREKLRLEADQLRAKIAAKETLVRSVEEKQSLALRPLGNRVVDPSDMDLYLKYKEELPADRERLRGLEERLR